MTEPLSYLLTFTQERWTTGVLAELPRIRQVYGPVIAEAAEEAKFFDMEALEVPTIDQVRATLRGVAALGREADLRRVDPISDAFLQEQSGIRYGTLSWDRLPNEGLIECAHAAAERADLLRGEGGRPTNLKVLARLVALLCKEWDNSLKDRELKRIKERRERRKEPIVHSQAQRQEDQFRLGRARRRMLRLVLSAVGVRRASRSYLEKLERVASGVL